MTDLGYARCATDLLVNIDVPDLRAAEAFYAAAFGLSATRRFGTDAVEMSGWPVRLYLLEKPAGSVGAPGSIRDYARHWTPVHLDVAVGNIADAVARAVAAGATVERPAVAEGWGKIAGLVDPFGNGLCLIQFLGRGYDEIADRVD